MRRRGKTALMVMALGIALIAIAVGSMLMHLMPFPGIPLIGVVGVVLLGVGLLLLVTELVENWLSKGQAALVDGLQAG